MTGPRTIEIHLEELGEHSWALALANTMSSTSGSAQYRFVARPPGEPHRARDHVLTGSTFPAMRFQDLEHLQQPNAWIDTARERLEELDAELRTRGWTQADTVGAHWWSRTYVAG